MDKHHVVPDMEELLLGQPALERNVLEGAARTTTTLAAAEAVGVRKANVLAAIIFVIIAISIVNIIIIIITISADVARCLVPAVEGGGG